MKRFIVIEGVDGVGKTTLAKSLCKQLKGAYYKTPPTVFETINHKGNTFSLKAHLAQDFIDSPRARFLFYLSGVLLASKEISHLLKQSDVVCDRYLSSTMAYHFEADVALRELDLAPLQILQPDIELLLTIQDQDSLAGRLNSRPNKSSNQNIKTLFRVQSIFRELSIKEIDVTNKDATTVLKEAELIVGQKL